MNDNDLLDVEEINRGSAVRWIVPLILLVLVLALVTAAVSSNLLPIASSGIDVVLFVLTALLCTLVAVSLTLTGCEEHFTRLTQDNEQTAADVISVRNEQSRLRDALQQAIRESSERVVGSISAVAAEQKQLDGKADNLRDLAQTIAGSITHVADGQAGIAEALQDKTQVLTDNVGALTQVQQTLQAEISQMARSDQQIASAIAAMAAEQTAWHETATKQKQELNGKIARLSENQASLKTDLKGLGEKTDRAMGETTVLADRQACFGETLHAHTEALDAQTASLAAGQEQLDGSVSHLQVLAQTVASSVTRIADEQAALHGALRDNTQALTDNIGIVEQYQQILQAETGKVAEAGQQTVASLAAVAAEQTALNEGIRSTNEELTGQMGALSDNQQALQATVQSLNEKTDRAVEEVTALAAEHASVGEALQNHTEAVTAQIAGLVASHGQLDTDVNSVRDLAQTLVGSVTGVSNEQAALQQSLRDNTQELADYIRAVEQNQKILQKGVCGLDEKAAQMATEQAVWRETAQTQNEELSGKLVALLESQLTFHGGVNNLGEKTSQVVSSLAGVAAEQAAVKEALQAHAEAVNSQMSALAAGQGQVDTGVHTLQDLTQTLASRVAAMSDEQATLHASLQDKTQLLGENIEALGRSQQAVQTEIHKVAEAGERSVARVTELADEQTTLHKAMRTHTEELTGQMGALTESQRSLLGGVNSLGDKMGHVTAEVTALNTRQTSVGEALQAHADVSNTQMSELTAGQAAVHGMVKTQNEELAGQLSTLCENQQDIRVEVHKVSKTGQDSAAAITAIATEQAALHETVKTQNEELAGQLSTLCESQQDVQVEVHKVSKTGQDSAAAITAIATEQAALHETVKTQNEGFAGQLSTLCENQQDIRVEVHKVAKTGQDSAAAITTIATEQAALHETVKTQNEGLAGQLSALCENQQDVQVEVHKVAKTGQDSAAAITAMAAEQAALHETVQTHGEELTGRLSTISEDQRTLCTGIHGLNERATQMAAGIDSVANEQLTTQQLVQNNKREMAETMAGAAREQQAMQAALAQLQQTAQTVSDRIVALAETQDTLKETLHQANEQLVGGLTTLSSNHGQLHSNVNSLRELAQTVAGHVRNIAQEQAALNGTLQGSTEELSGSAAAIEQSQKTLEVRVNSVAEATRQAAATVTAMAAEQARLLKAITAGNEELTGQIAALSENQQVGREDLVTKLATVAHVQHEWMERFDDAEARTHAIVASLDTLEQNALRFEQTLQASIQDLINLLDAEGQHRMQFEETVNQDLKAIADAVSLIGEIRASLEAQTPPAEHDPERQPAGDNAETQPADNNAQAPCQDIAWAVEQLRRGVCEPRPGNNGTNPDLPGTGSTSISTSRTHSSN